MGEQEIRELIREELTRQTEAKVRARSAISVMEEEVEKMFGLSPSKACVFRTSVNGILRLAYGVQAVAMIPPGQEGEMGRLLEFVKEFMLEHRPKETKEERACKSKY